MGDPLAFVTDPCGCTKIDGRLIAWHIAFLFNSDNQ
jgi:hypothetical protein